MGILVAITPTGVLLAILIILLLAWMVTFTFLALRRPQETGLEEREAAIAQPRVAAKPSVSENFSKISALAIKPTITHQQLAHKEAALEQSIR